MGGTKVSPDHFAGAWFSVPGLRLRDHRFTVPLDYSIVDHSTFPTISVFAREVVFGVLNGSTVQTVVAVERTVFYTERAAGIYSAMPYGIRLGTGFDRSAIHIMSIGSLWCHSLSEDWGLNGLAVNFLWYLYFVVFTFLYSTFYGMMTMAMTPNACRHCGYCCICHFMEYGISFQDF